MTEVAHMTAEELLKMGVHPAELSPANNRVQREVRRQEN
jgi:hypothetical protein